MGNSISYEAVKQAKKELREEEFREEVEKVKAKIKSMRKHRFPWRLRVKIINLNKL